MPPFIWRSKYSVNIQAIDAQHQQLVETINKLNDAMTAGKGQAVLSDIFDELIKYMTAHFSTEEGLMAAYAFPQYLEHKAEHDKFVATVQGLKDKFDHGDTGTVLTLSQFVVDWFQQHTLKMDMKYVRFFHGKGLA